MKISARAVYSSSIIPFCLAAGIWAAVPSCSSENAAAPGWSSSAGGSSSSAGGSSSVSKPACTPAVSTKDVRPHEAGNYDNRSCNATDCHNDMNGGGWVYTSIKGPPFSGGATITITNADGTIVTANSAVDGFFQIVGKVVAPYKVCVSKCPGVECNTTVHPHADCQVSGCHGSPTQRIYVSGNDGGAPSSGGSSSGGGGSQDCTPPASGGPYTHTEYVFGNQPCSGSSCHSAPKPVFKGGFLYDGPESKKTVAEATITLTDDNGKKTTAVTGPDGMFFFGTIAATSKATDYGAPYTVCVSKCPLKVCGTSADHKNADDCYTCHDGMTAGKVYLK